MRNWNYLLLLALSVVLFACGEDDADKPFKLHHHSAPAPDKTITTDFNANVFQSGVEAELLKELKLCDPTAPNDTDEKRPSCSPRFFRFFPLNKKIELKNGFILLVKAGVNDFPLRRILIFTRERGQLIKLNGFNGNLIEQRKTASGYDDLMIRFADNIDGSLCYYNCLFQWNGGQYAYKNCEVIDEGGPRRVKAEFMDSMAVEIKKVLDENKMIF